MYCMYVCVCSKKNFTKLALSLIECFAIFIENGILINNHWEEDEKKNYGIMF
jgi:hypothetical protein